LREGLLLSVMRLLTISLILLFGSSRLLAREIPITVLHTCDLHGNVLPTENYQGQTNLGGIARCATMIRQIREQEKNVLLVDAGDTIQGTEISYATGGQAMVRALNFLHYDAWVWGNHEFDWGLEALDACARRAEMPLLNANVHAAGTILPTDSPTSRILRRLKPYVLIEVDGVKVGIVGLNTPGIPNWSRPQLIGGLRFSDSVEELKAIVPALRRAGAQVLVLVCHQGYREGGDDHANQVNAIARNFPEFDVIIGGHTHRNFSEFKVGNVLYCQADYFGIHLGRVDLVFDTEKNRVIRRSSNTLLMDDKVALDPQILELLGAEIDQSQKVLATVIGEATGDFGLQGAPKRETPIHDLVFAAIAEALHSRGVMVDAIVHGILDRRATLPKGPITIGDVWKIIPYENTIGVAQLTQRELREILDENAAAFEKREFRGIWGLKWEFDPDAGEGERVVSLQRADGEPLKEEDRLAVAFNSYDLASGGLRWKKLREIVDRPEAKLVEYDLQTRQAVIDYIRKHGTIAPSTGDWWRVSRKKQEASAAPKR
jgi:2',3'-cyclic-nucleotide 2'-phosphodiesterase (5'-nucleotidase family)